MRKIMISQKYVPHEDLWPEIKILLVNVNLTTINSICVAIDSQKKNRLSFCS